MSSYIGPIMATSCALCWAIAVMLFRRVGIADPRALNLFKNTIASAMLLLTMLAVGRGFDLSRSGEDWLRLAASGLLGLTIGDTLFFMGIQRIGASVAAVTDCAYSPTVVMFAFVFLDEPLGLGLLLGAPLVVIGLLIVSWQSSNQAKHLAVDRLGVLYAVAGVVSTALAVIVAKPVLNRSNLLEATTVRLLVGVISLLVVQAATGRLRSSIGLFVPQRIWKTLLPATIVGTYISMLLWLGGIKYNDASVAAILNQLATVFLLLLSRFVLQEHIPLRRWLGAGIALCGVVLVLALPAVKRSSAGAAENPPSTRAILPQKAPRPIASNCSEPPPRCRPDGATAGQSTTLAYQLATGR